MRLAMLVMAILLTAGIAAAQPPADVGQTPNARAQRLERLGILLDLTDTQKLQVQQVLEEQHAKMKALHQQTLAALKPLLTADQYRKLEVLSQEHAGRRGWHHPPAAPPASTN